MATINKIYYNWDAYGIESSWLVTTQPTNPVEWAMYYDATNDVVKFYDGTNWIALWSGSWDVVWPGSSVDWHLAVFDGTTWKTIKDWGAVPTKVSDLTNDSWFITWISGNDVTTALWYTPANNANLWTAATKNTWTASWNVPVLDSNWHLASSVIPWVALTDTFTVSASSDLTTLSNADQWDIAIVTGENKTYVLSQAPYSTAANWKQILTPTEWVTSVNGQTWAVTLSIPTDTLDLTNWAGYITSSDIPTDYVKTSWNQTIAWTKTFSTSPVVPSKTTAATNSWTKIATEAQVYKKQDTISDLATIRSWAAAWATALQPWDVPWNIFLTQSAYDALPSSKTSDWNTYLIIS